jgi:D-3-phosphoglycerate dehydrogenase
MRAGVAVASHSFSKNPTLCRELLEQYPQSVFNETRQPLGSVELVQLLRGYEKAITGLEILDESIFSALPDLKIVSKYGVGLDTIDLAAARRHDVNIRWTPGVNRQAVAELAIAFMIALARRLLPLASEVRQGVWTHGGGRQLSSATVGIVGCGHVGKTVARLCRAFGARVIAYDVVDYADFYRECAVTPVSLQTLLSESDFVTLHVPLDTSTKGMIGRAQIASMKDGAFLINTARGGIVDEQELKRALLNHKLGGAAFDVFATEPLRDTELSLLPNFVGTPHIGGSSVEAVLAMGRAAIAGLDDDSRTINR